MTFCRKECDCYGQYIDCLGKSFGRCLGTKEIETCDCGGDESKCDFYPERRKKSKKPSFYDIIQELIENNFELTIRRGTDFEEMLRVSVRDRNNGIFVEQHISKDSNLFFNFEESLLEIINYMIHELKE